MKKVIFMHIPKSGGSTIQTILEKNYDKHNICHLQTRDDMVDFMKLPKSRINEFACVAGHMGFGYHRFFDEKIEYITLLRDPIERVISLYYYILRTPEHHLYEKVRRESMSLEEFVASDMTHETSEGQARLIASQDGLGINFATKRQIDDEDLKRAKNNLLEYFAVVGTLDRFDAFLTMCARNYGWRDISYTPQNVREARPRRDRVSSEAIALIKGKNRIDIELYLFAHELFSQMLAAESSKV